MQKYSKAHLYIVGVIVLIWIVLESIFYSIAKEAQEEYEANIVSQAHYFYEEIQGIWNWSLSLKGLYAPSQELPKLPYLSLGTISSQVGELERLSPVAMIHLFSQGAKSDFLRYKILSNTPLNLQNRAEGFYAKSLLEYKEDGGNEAKYELDKEAQRLHYIKPLYVTKLCIECHKNQEDTIGALRGGISVDMDASFIIKRVEIVWRNFFFVSFISAVFVGFIIYFILNMNRQKLSYFYKSMELEKGLEKKVKELNQVLFASGLGYWEWDLVTGEHKVDSEWLKMLGLQSTELEDVSQDWSDRIEPSDREAIMPTIQKAIEHKGSYVVEFRMRHAKGHYIWIQGSGGVTELDADGKAAKLSGTHQDITQRKLLEIEQKSNEGYLSTLFEHNPNIILVTDGEKIVQVNNAFFRLFSEYDSLEDFMQEHKCICEFFVAKEGDEFIRNAPDVWIEDVLTISEPIVKLEYKKRSYYFAVYAKKLYKDEGLRIIITFNDISEIYALRERFEKLSTIDELTQIYNRRHFNRVFTQETNRAMREEHSFSLAIMDIDNFKLYNDTYGHDAGDAALVEFSSAVDSLAKRSNEFFFRLGGEEFGVIFSAKSYEESLSYLEEIMDVVQKLNIYHEKNLPSKRFTISIGLAYVTPQRHMDMKKIYKEADLALYRAKQNGRNRVESIKL